MTLKKDTVQRLIGKMQSLLTYWRGVVKSGEHVKMSISEGNTKIGKTINVSLPPIISCGNCGHCMYTCYAVKNLVRRGITVINAWVKNYAVLLENRAEYFRQIREKCRRRRKNKFLRWHVSGDIPDMDYLNEMNTTARMFPDFKSWTYTEMFGIVNDYCRQNGGREAVAENLNIMFSDWSLFTGKEVPNPYGFNRFIVVPANTPKGKMPQGFYCPGNCDICKSAGVGCLGNGDVYCKEH